MPTIMTPRATAPLPASPQPAAPPPDPRAGRLRRFVMAALVGAAVIVAPGGPSPGRGPGWRPPAYERALRWRDIIRLRLSPWLLSRSQDPPGALGDLPELPRSGRWPWA